MFIAIHRVIFTARLLTLTLTLAAPPPSKIQCAMGHGAARRRCLQLAREAAILSNSTCSTNLDGTTSEDACAACMAPLSTADYRVVPVRNHNRSDLLKTMAVHRSNHDAVSRIIAERGYWDLTRPHALAELAGSRLPEGTSGAPPVFLDIGSNLGFYTLLFASAGFDVIAIDAMDHNRRALNASLCLNPALARRVTLIPAALGAPSDEGRKNCRVEASRLHNGGIGNGVLHCDGRRSNMTRAPGAAAPVDAAMSSEVALTTLDALLLRSATRPDRVDVVKIDIEGSECQMLEGASSVLDRFKPKLIQWEGKMALVDECVRRALRERGYRISAPRYRDRNTVAVSAVWDQRVHHEQK